MSKYTNQQLKEMADTLRQVKLAGDFKYVQFLMSVALKAGVSPDYVENKIKEYSQL